jgi:hypothetical protein
MVGKTLLTNFAGASLCAPDAADRKSAMLHEITKIGEEGISGGLSSPDS